jgi:hypothetical protein
MVIKLRMGGVFEIGCDHFKMGVVFGMGVTTSKWVWSLEWV